MSATASHAVPVKHVDCCRFAGVSRFQDLFPFMPEGWSRHFDRYEWTGSIDVASNHIRVSDKLRHPPMPPYDPASDPDGLRVVLANQGLAVNGWADTVGAAVFLDALNAYALAHWTSPSSKIALIVSPHDPARAAAQVRAQAGNPAVAAVSLPLTATLMGSGLWDPLWQACSDVDLPVIIHFSGVEGSYLGAAPLSGASHGNALSRHILMPHLAESNIASLCFEGTFYRFPGLRVLFAGFGFRWLPSLIRRMNQEWRNFRSDMPWVRDRPGDTLLGHVWVSTYPVGEATDPDAWIGEFGDDLMDRIVFASNAPFDADGLAQVETTLGRDRTARFLRNGAEFLRVATPEEG